MLDSRRIVGLLLKDAVPTLGEPARTEVLQLVANYETLAREWMQSGKSLTEVQRSFNRHIVEGLQQTAHDLFWDTTWPTCPRHPQHPLWYDEDHESWCCNTDGVAVAPIGRLADARSPGP